MTRPVTAASGNPVMDFLRLAGPMVISRAGIAGMSIADGVMVARNAPSQLALLGLSEGTLGRALDVLVALLLGGIVLAARAHASGSTAEAGAVWRRAMSLAVFAGLLGLVAGCTGRWWLGWLGEPEYLVAGAAPVVLMLGIGIPAVLAALGTAVFLEAVGRAPAVAIAVVAANIANLALNWLLIGGGPFQDALGIPSMGAFGSALATTLVRAGLMAALVIYAWTLPDHVQLGLRAPAAGLWTREATVQRRLGYGAAATAGVLNALGMSLTIFAGWLGAMPLAAMAALWNALSIGALLALGLADATALRVASVSGRSAGDNASRLAARSATWAACGLGLGITLAALSLLLVPVIASPLSVVGIYTQSGALREAMAALLPLGALALMCDGAAFVVGAALRGLQDVAWPTGIQIAVAAILMPLAWWLAIHQGGGAIGLVQSILLTSVLRTGLLLARLRIRIGGGLAADAVLATQTL